MIKSDALFSSDPSEIKSLVIGTNNIWKGLGLGNYNRTEKKKIYRLEGHYICKRIRKGSIIKEGDIRLLDQVTV